MGTTRRDSQNNSIFKNLVLPQAESCRACPISVSGTGVPPAARVWDSSLTALDSSWVCLRCFIMYPISQRVPDSASLPPRPHRVGISSASSPEIAPKPPNQSSRPPQLSPVQSPGSRSHLFTARIERLTFLKVSHGLPRTRNDARISHHSHQPRPDRPPPPHTVSLALGAAGTTVLSVGCPGDQRSPAQAAFAHYPEQINVLPLVRLHTCH